MPGRFFPAKNDASLRPGIEALGQTGDMTEPLPAELDITTLWQDYRPTSLIELPELAHLAKVGRVFVKAEGERPLGNFKVLGGMIAGLRAIAKAVGAATLHDLHADDLRRDAWPRLICASDGNHGLAVAAAARRAGTNASIYLPVGVSRARAERIEAHGGDIVWIAGTYDAAVRDAAAAAARGEGLLIADTSSDPDDSVVKDVMAGYALISHELVAQFRDQARDRPGHLFIQAGVGGLAAAMAEGLADWLQAPGQLWVVEPEAAACVARALEAGRPVPVPGDLKSSAGMLSCGLASAPALQILQRHKARSVLVGDDELQAAVDTLRNADGPDTTPSGAAGLAGLLQVAARPQLRAAHRLGKDSVVLLIVTEGPVVG